MTEAQQGIVQRWVNALRSGEYEQGFGSLRGRLGFRKETIGFCCLGVLCDLAVKDGVIPEPSTVSDVAYYGDAKNGISATGLPKTVMEWAGIQTTDGAYHPVTDDVDVRDALAEQNDRGMNFSHIADLIESKPNGLFVK